MSRHCLVVPVGLSFETMSFQQLSTAREKAGKLFHAFFFIYTDFGKNVSCLKFKQQTCIMTQSRIVACKSKSLFRLLTDGNCERPQQQQQLSARLIQGSSMSKRFPNLLQIQTVEVKNTLGLEEQSKDFCTPPLAHTVFLLICFWFTVESEKGVSETLGNTCQLANLTELSNSCNCRYLSDISKDLALKLMS